MVVDAVLTRSGVFEYRNPDGSQRLEYRPPEEVFNQDSIDTFSLRPVTNGHPGEMVTADNTRDYIVGATGNDVRADGEHLVAQLVVFDTKAIADIEGGKQEVSCGYEVTLDETPGITPEGDRYDVIQRQIIGNHVAIVENGRAGPSARIRMDTAYLVEGKSPHTTSSIKVKNMDLEQALKKIEELQFEKAKEQLRADAAERDVKEAKDANAVVSAERDTARDKLEASEKVRKDSADAFNDQINEAVALRLAASTVIPDDDEKGLARFDGMSDREIKCAVIKQVTGKDVPEDKCDIYVGARFDSALEVDAVSTETLDDARSAGKVAKMDTVLDASGKAEASMHERHANAWKDAN